jgi:hypothetical protein
LSNKTANKFVVVERGRAKVERKARENVPRTLVEALGRKYVSLLYIKQIFVSNFATTLVVDIAQRAVDSLRVVKRTTKSQKYL